MLGIRTRRSSLSWLAANNTTPATSISAAPAIGPAGSEMRDPNTDPKAQLADASKKSAARRSDCPQVVAGDTQAARCPVASAMPAHSNGVAHAPQQAEAEGKQQHRRYHHRRDAGRHVLVFPPPSPGPLPTASSRMPMAPAASHCFGVGSAWPRQARKLNQYDAGYQKANPGHHQRRPLFDAQTNDEIEWNPKRYIT